MARPADKHLDSEELNALVPSVCETVAGEHLLAVAEVRDAERHVSACAYCIGKVNRYRELVAARPQVRLRHEGPQGRNCPEDRDVDWSEVVAGQWPEFKTRQLVVHAATCDHCGPLLRTAVQRKAQNAEHRAPAKAVPDAVPRPGGRDWRLAKILTPAFTAALTIAIIAFQFVSTTPVSGATFAEFAAQTHREHTDGKLALDVRSESQQQLNEWFKNKLQFRLALPVSPGPKGEEHPVRFEGARLVQVGGQSAAYVAYQIDNEPASLIVVPASVTVASGGSVADFKKVSFHYSMVNGYKVVTWSQHDLTYALVSQEGNGSQKSCMVCHSAMHDRDLSHTPTPLSRFQNSAGLILQ